MLMVLKFGGTSVAGPEAVRRSAGIIADAVAQGAQVAAVLSAQGDTTDALLSTASLYNPNPSPRELDMLLSTGEQASVALMAMALEDMGLDVVSLTGWQSGVETDSTHGSARILRLSMGRVLRELSAGKVVLIAGFQGVSKEGDITTLGRGGSDTTAVAAAAALRADLCRIYTDVEGVYTADPRLVPTAVKLSEIDTEEMLRLAAHGSQVLHERSVELAGRFSVPLEVLSSFVHAPGTQLRPLPLPWSEGRLTAMTASGDLVTLVGTNLHAYPALGRRATELLQSQDIPVEAYLETDGYLSVQVPPEYTLTALRLMHREFIEQDM